MRDAPAMRPRTEQQARTLVVVFGAGASADSIGRAVTSPSTIAALGTGRPPLARELFDLFFDRFVQAHRTAGTLVAELRQLPGTVSLEGELDRIQGQEAPGDSTRRRELASLRYYLRDLLATTGRNWGEQAPGQTNYHILLKRLARWRERMNTRIAFVSFNYDTLLDRAVEDVLGISLQTIERYVSDKRFRLFKPHGSVNWVRALNDKGTLPVGLTWADTEREITNLAGSTSGLELSDTYTVIEEPAVGTIAGRIVVPALTIPVLEKRDFEFPQEHQDALKEWVPDALWVLIVGWRASEKNFMQLWGSTPRFTQPRVLAICRTRDTARAVVGTLRDHDIRASRLDEFEGGFTDFLSNQGLLDSFLAQM